MVGLNKVIVIGNLGTDPEMRFIPAGNPVTSFRIASTNRAYTTPEGERKEDTEWFTVVAWDRLAEQCNQYLTKGRRAYVEGRLRSRQWEGQDGKQRFVNEIVANRVLFLDRQSDGQSDGQSGGQSDGGIPSEGEAASSDDVEELPF